jgi:hypothetical protein
MTRHDYLTHIGLALFFFVVLSPFLLSQGDQFGVRIYFAGTIGLVVIATVARIFGKERS